MFRQFLDRVIATRAGWSPLALRVPVGIIFIAHGAQKLFGWFGGGGLQGTAEVMASLGLHPGYLMGLLAGSAEFFGGVLLIAGFLVRPAGAVLAFTMGVAIFAAHFQNGLFLSNGGYEYGLALLAVSVALSISGAGRVSVDEWLAQPRTAADRTTATGDLGRAVS
jgi:putative oxidoreductase